MMSVEIPPEFQQFVQHVVRTGRFQNEANVIGEALRLLEERERRLDELRQEIDPALERLDRGEGIELDDDTIDGFFDDIKARGRKTLEARQHQK